MSVENLEGEVWKPIPEWEGWYEASSLGRIRSVDRFVNYNRKGFFAEKKGKLLVQSLNSRGYNIIGITKNGKFKTYAVHKLIMNTFSGKSGLTIDHINGDKLDNRLINLEHVDLRENISRYIESTGVNKNDIGVKKSSKNRFISRIWHNNKRFYLGIFKNKEEAGVAYQKALKKIKNGNAI